MGKVLKGVAIVAAVAVNFVPGFQGWASAAIWNAGLSVGVSVGTGLAISSAVFAGITALGIASALSFIAPGMPTVKQSGGGVALNYRQPVVNAPIVYGRARIGGPIIFYHARQVAGDPPEEYRYLIVTIAAHEIEEIESIWLNDAEVTLGGSNMVTTGDYASAAWIWGQTGTTSDTPPSVFTSETSGRWTSSHQGKGIAKLYCKFKLTDDVIGQGIPKITAVIKGKNDIYDPRDESTGYTNNAILCMYDWLLTSRRDGGFGVVEDGVDWDFVATQADICDEDVDLASGGTEKRYCVDGVIDTGAGADTIRDALLLAMAGDYSYSDVVKVYPGAWRSVSHQISAGDIVGAVQYNPLVDDASHMDGVRGVFVSEANMWQPVEFPSQGDLETNDRVADIELAFTKSGAAAQRIARILLRRSQMQRALAFPMNLRGLPIETIDNVQVSHPRYPHVGNLSWSVRSWAIGGDFGISLQLREEEPEIYEWSTADEQAVTVASQSLVEPDVSQIGAGAAPAGITATAASASQIDVQVTMPSSYFTGYTIYRSTTNDITTAAAVSSGTAVPSQVVTYNDTGLTAETTYYYWSRTFTFSGGFGGGQSAPTGPASDTTPA